VAIETVVEIYGFLNYYGKKVDLCTGHSKIH